MCAILVCVLYTTHTHFIPSSICTTKHILSNDVLIVPILGIYLFSDIVTKNLNVYKAKKKSKKFLSTNF